MRQAGMVDKYQNSDTTFNTTIDEMNRLLEIRKLLASVLTPEEIDQINMALNGLFSIDRINHKSTEPIQLDR